MTQDLVKELMALADEYAGTIAARDLVHGACDFPEIVERWTKAVPIARAALESALRAALPADWVMVPREPTLNMQEAMDSCRYGASWAEVWKHAVAAAPTAGRKEGE